MREENFRQRPDPQAPHLATVRQGVVMERSGQRGMWNLVELEGWIWRPSVGPISSPEFDLEVTARGGENLRDAPNGSILARVSRGTWLEELERRENWIHVRRVAWMWARSLEEIDIRSSVGDRERASEVTPEDTVGTDADTSTAVLDRALLPDSAVLLDTPDGALRASTEQGVPVRVLARSGEWTRVSIEGWVRTDLLEPYSGEVLVGVTSAEVRANPEEFVGRLVQWDMQFIALQTADELRRDIPTGSQFILARGPHPEPGFVYVVVPPDRVAQVEELAPLSEVVVVGRVVRASSSRLGNPILNLVDLAVFETQR